MRNSVDSISDIKNISGRRSIRAEEISSRKNVNNNEDRSISEPPQGYSAYLSVARTTSSRLKPIREKIKNDEEEQGSTSESDDLSKSNSQLNESDLDLPDSVSQTPTPTPLGQGNARRINSETNLNDSKRRMTGFMGNRSKRFCASTSELSFASHLDTRKSLFSPKNNTPRALSRSSLFGSSNSLNSTNSRLFMVNSPFYNGKTMFGGASAYPKKDINQAKVLRTPIQMRPSSSLSNSSNTSTKSDGMVPESNAAKRILEVMNQFSGPLKEARSMGSNINSIIKLPGLAQNRKRYGEDDLNLDRSISLSRPAAPYGRPLASATKTRSDSPLHNIAATLTNSTAQNQVPTMSQLLKMKRLQNNTERVREIANRSESFLNQLHDYKLPEEASHSTTATSTSGSLKMKSNITKNLLRNDKGVDQTPPAPLNLPNIQLPELKSIPKFDIQLPATSTPTISSSSSTVPLNVNSKSITSFTPAATQMSFKTITSSTLSLPTTKIADDLMNGQSEFRFGKPIKLSSDFDMTKLIAVNERFTFSKPSAISSVSSLAKVGDDSEKQTALKPTDNLFKNLVAQQKSQWECDSCLTRNDSDKNKCLCCEARRPDSGISSQSSSFESVAPTAPSKPIVADDLFKSLAAKQKTSQWECDVCMCKNDLDKEKCLSCESPKPGSKKSSTSSSLLSTNSSGFKFGMPSVNDASSSSEVKAVASDDLFKSLAAQQKKTQWECDTCMTRNDVNSEKCLACEAPKPGSKSTPTKTSSFSFGMPASSKNFSFGMPATSTVTEKTTDSSFQKLVEKQNSKWECSVCMTRNEQSCSKCICCEQQKPGTSDSQPQFLFGSNKSSEVALPKPSEVKFSFGVQPTSTEKKNDDEVDKPKQTFSFGAAPASTSKDATSSVSTFTFKAPVSSASTVSASFTIKSPPAKDDKIEAPKSSMFSFGAPKSSEEKVSKKVHFEEKTKESVEEPKKKIVTEQKKIETIQAFNATGFKFGGFTKDEEKKSDDKPSGGFTFGSPANLNEKPSSTTSATSSLTGFSFSASKPETNETKTTFGSFSAPSTTTTATFGSIASDSKSTFSFGMAKKEETTVAPQTSSAFSSPASSSSAFAAAKPGGFSFGSTENKPAAPSSTGGFSFSSPANPVFGSSQENKTTTNSTSSNNFVFGQAKSDQQETPKPRQTFGSFSSPSTQATPVFGDAVKSTPSFSFSAVAKEQPQQPSSVFAFGGAKASPSQPTMIFGSNAASSTPNLTPVFGSNATPTFGSNIAANNNNNESGFGSKMVNFGAATTIPSSNQPLKRAFDFGSAQPEVPQKKTFEFGSQIAPQQQLQQPQTNASPFQFNAQTQQPQQPASVDSARSAFNFNATAPPAFNFTANTTVSNNTQENLFQFSANNSTSVSANQGIFAFGANTQPPQSAPVMFGSTAPTIAIPGINAFGAQTSNAQSRKILRAARRTNLTRR